MLMAATCGCHTLGVLLEVSSMCTRYMLEVAEAVHLYLSMFLN